MILVPADFAQAQTCSTGETATSNSGVNSGTCVKDSDLDVANACEAAGWSLDESAANCLIKVKYHDESQAGPSNPTGLTEGDFCGLAGGCAFVFADPLSFPPVQVSMGVTLNSETDARVFWAYCRNGEDPAVKNDAGQTQCCAPPTTDHDMNPDTACEEPAPVSACQNGGGCPANSFCQEQQGGGAECVCNPKWRGGTSGATAFAPDSGTTCEDTNECLTPILSCGAGGTCTNTEGSHSCVPCREGYRPTPGQPDDDPQCVDIDSCTEDSNYCNGNGQCRNFQGIVDQCDCDPGWEGNFCTERVVVTLNLSFGVGGTLSAKTADDPDVRDGGEVPIRGRVTFIATPDAGYYVSLWTGCGSPDTNTGGHKDGGEKTCATDANANLNVSVAFADIDECETDKKFQCHLSGRGSPSGRDGCTDHPTPNTDPLCKCGDGLKTTDGGRSCIDNCPAGLGGDECDADLPKVEMVVPSGGVTLHATPEADCYVQGWTDSACADATGSSGETGSAGRKSCVSSGTGEVTVGVFFECE